MIFHACSQEKNGTEDPVSLEFLSKVLAEKRRVTVHLPFNYSKETTKRYPVIYVVDGGSLDHTIAGRLFVLSSAGLVPECIVVGIMNEKGARERDLTPPFMQTDVDDKQSPHGQGDRFLKFIKEDLIPLIDSGYRTSAVRGLSGHSRGGLLVLYSQIAEPELFIARFCYSTPAWRFDNILVKKFIEGLKMNPVPATSYLYFSVGESENENIRSSFDLMEKMLNEAQVPDLKWESYVTPFADHHTNPVLSSARGFAGWGKTTNQ